MGDSLNRIKFVNPDTIPSSIEEAERIATDINGEGIIILPFRLSGNPKR